MVKISSYSLSEILEKLCDRDFSIQKFLPEKVIPAYEITHANLQKRLFGLLNSGSSTDADHITNEHDPFYITNTLLEENVRHVFGQTLMPENLKRALLRFTIKPDSDTRDQAYIDSAKQWKDNKYNLDTDDTHAIYKLYPHLLELIKALTLFIRNHHRKAYTSESDPDKVMYEAWLEVQSYVCTVWYIIWRAWKENIIAMNYKQISIDDIINNMNSGVISLREDKKKIDEKVDKLRGEWREAEEKLKQITELDTGVREKLIMANSQSKEIMRQIAEEENECHRIRKNLGRIALETNDSSAIRKMCELDKKEVTKYMEFLKSSAPSSFEKTSK